MLTGKDIHAMFYAANSGVRVWDHLNTYDKQVYEEVASVLNGSRIAPLQGQVAGLEEQNTKLTADIKALRELDRKIFDDQDKQIDALKGMVRDFVTFTVKWNWELGEEAQKRRELVALAQGLLSAKES